MILPLAYFGAPVLRKKGAPVQEITDEIRQIVSDMTETMNLKNGIGLAAPQVNHSIALFIIMTQTENEDDTLTPGHLNVFINPKITYHSEEVCLRSEGCLSIPKVYGDVWRPEKISIRYTTLEGNDVEEMYSGLNARIILHENDHINGVLFIDRMHPKERKKLEQQLFEIKKKFKSRD